VVDEMLLHRGLADRVMAISETVGVLTAAEGRLQHGQRQQLFEDMGRGGVGQLRRPSLFRHQGGKAVAGDDRSPFVVAGAGDAHLAACR
jgi:hypothetical protein